jgi:hypothetical protein
VDAKRSAYIDQVQYLLDHTYLNYGVYASNWKAQYIPSDGLGRMDEGNAILAPWPLDDATRFQLPLRADLDGLTRLLLRAGQCASGSREHPRSGQPSTSRVHPPRRRFATDDTKQRQVDECAQRLLKRWISAPATVVRGRRRPEPAAVPTRRTRISAWKKACAGEHFHGPNDNPYHREGANYTPELAWINPFFEQFQSSMTLDQYIADEQAYFSYSILNGPWDRTLDYLFSNSAWAPGSHKAHQDVRSSDHCPVTAQWVIPK